MNTITRPSPSFKQETVIDKPGLTEVNSKLLNPIASKKLIRFQVKKENYVWVKAGEILFAESADHYVKALIQISKETKWVIRHCTLKELLSILPTAIFIRLNKFYLLNCNHFSHFDDEERMLYSREGLAIPIRHRIEPYILDFIRKTTIREM